jgi:hypothetical protein
MTTHHLPDLEAINAVTNREVRFYAMLGALVSVTAAVELVLFDVFEKAAGLPQGMAAKIFYGTNSTGARRDIALAAMTEHLAGKSEVAEWTGLSGRIVAATGNSADRHLVAHNPVGMAMEMIEIGLGTYHDDLGTIQVVGPPGTVAQVSRREFSVTQDAIQILARKRKADEVDFQALTGSCKAAITLLSDLEAFLEHV